MKVLGQGWSSSGDYLNIYSRELLSGIKLIDDGCLQPTLAQETYNMTANVMLRAIRENFKFSIEKFQIGPSIIFAGLSLVTSSSGRVTVKPDPDRISQLLALPSPKCKQDVLTHMGMLATLRKCTPNLSFVDAPIRALTKKNVQFMWDSQLETCLNEVRTQVRKLVPLEPFDTEYDSIIYTDACSVGVGYILIQKSPDAFHVHHINDTSFVVIIFVMILNV